MVVKQKLQKGFYKGSVRKLPQHNMQEVLEMVMLRQNTEGKAGVSKTKELVLGKKEKDGISFLADQTDERAWQIL